MSPRSVGIIGGAGWIGRAMARRILESGLVAARSVTLSSRSGSGPTGELQAGRWTQNNQQLTETSDVVIIAVRPEQFSSVGIAASGKFVISVMAGVSAATIRGRTGCDRIVRAMPNAAVSIGGSYTPWFATTAVTRDDKGFVQALFEACGSADEVSREADLDYFVGLTGSGPAFPALLAKAMIDHAVSKGFDPDLARRAVRGVVVAASQLLATEGNEASELVQTFIDYRGTTAAALQEMIDLGFIKAVHAGLRAAEAKALEIAAGTGC
jgi:pyrroline-5-carboxylate reductase